MAANFSHQTIWTGDNLDIMRGMNSECVDLIYLDPPFNSNRNYAAPIGSEAAGAAFKDTWTLSDVDEAWHGEIADREPAIYAIIDAAKQSHGKAMKSYLIMMAVMRLSHRLVGELSNTVWEGCASTEVGRSSCTGGLSAPREVVYSLSSMAPWAWAKALGRCAIA